MGTKLQFVRKSEELGEAGELFTDAWCAEVLVLIKLLRAVRSAVYDKSFSIRQKEFPLHWRA